ARQPIAVTFKNWDLRWLNCRPVNPTNKNPAYTAEAVLGSYGLVWKEADLDKSPSDQHRLMQRNQAEFQKRCTGEPVPVVVAVTEKKSSDPSKPGASNHPKLLVFGSSLF